MARLKVDNLRKSFAGTPAVDDFSLDVADGELVCLLGPSGSGKSTILRMIGGFEQPTSGTVRIDGQEVTRLPPERRPTGMVFQSHALWSHMNVFNNIAFGLKLRGLPRSEIRRKVDHALELVGLGGYGHRQTFQLSGGQQQRVALARSLVLEPKILLLDEPFASLDQHLRERLREEVRDIQQRLRITTLFVTHGQDEALAMADRIVVLRDGRCEQVDAPDLLYRHPRTQFVAGFIGQMNFLAANVEAGRFHHSDFPLPVAVQDGPAVLALRPEALRLARSLSPDAATVTRVTDFGSHIMVDVELSDQTRIKTMTAPDSRWQRGDHVSLVASDFALYRNNALLIRSSMEEATKADTTGAGGKAGSETLKPVPA
ncbi:ABC transporter ATP-binding protein [Rhizobium sp. SSA_523]|uniref:ABC transporter ATP-binding protein n=1 Tax=Rhizobium sp. SSA_523 TaxID=2952477 RepID=UPI002090BCBE|nr:ABC transporter ATP-binding protein [Rhizobium sp. SSA_523]MCO5732958.1 ABC transporter ATP-binding protein [Rhizobium sp. SSA_523]WKC23843.1 ABC transporter ATP-binding protein [Rhizobium sp. SSA_523]